MFKVYLKKKKTFVSWACCVESAAEGLIEQYYYFTNEIKSGRSYIAFVEDLETNEVFKVTVDVKKILSLNTTKVEKYE